MKRPFTLIHSRGSSDTERCVAALGEGVQAKKVIGLAYVVMYQQRNYEVHVCGEAARSPTFTHGAVAALARKVGRMVDGLE